MGPGHRRGARSRRVPGTARGVRLAARRAPHRRRLLTGALRTAGCLLLVLLGACRAPAPAPSIERLRAENAEAEDRWDWARIHWAEHRAIHPDDLEALHREGIAWISGTQQSLSTGVERLTAYLGLRPDDVETRRRLVEVLLQLGEWDRADEMAAGLPEEPIDRRLRAEAKLETAPETAAAIVALALAEDGGDPRILALAARIADRRGASEEALDHARAALAANPFDRTSAYLVGRLARRSDPDEARRALTIHRLLGRLQDEGTRAPVPPDEALVLLDELEALVETVTPAMRRERARLLFGTGRLPQAAELAADLAADPGTPEAFVAELAVSAGNAGLATDARALFARVLERTPGHRGAITSLALLDLEAGDLLGARRRLEALLELHPHFARAHVVLGRVAMAEDRAAEARFHFEQAVDLAPWSWPWREQLADLLLALGDEAAFRKLLSDVPEESPAVAVYRRRHHDRLSG